MKQYNQSSKKPETMQPKAANQAPVETLLNDYKPGVQLKSGKEEELLQGKFDTTQLAGKEEELLQGKFETAQLKSGEEEEPLQKKENNTGLPDNLKSGVENLSGHSLDDVKVHYNSSQPGQLNAHAYAQGTDIHMAPGQEKHLPHEAWHVVQQKQGRVKPTMQMKGKVNVNDDVGLETEADVMGAKAFDAGTEQALQSKATTSLNNSTVQRVISYAKGGYTDEEHLKNSLYAIFDETAKPLIDSRIQEFKTASWSEFGGAVYKKVIEFLETKGHIPAFGVTTDAASSTHGPMLPEKVDRHKEKDEISALSTFNFSSVTLGKLSVIEDNSKISFHDRQIDAQFHAEDGLIEQLETYILKNSINTKEVRINLTINNFFCSEHSTGKSDKCNNCLDRIISLQERHEFAKFHVYFQNTYGDIDKMGESIKKLQSKGIEVSSFSAKAQKAPFVHDDLDDHSDSEEDEEDIDDQISFEEWKGQIADLVWAEYQLELDDLPDEPYMPEYEEGISPSEFYNTYMANGKAL